MPFNAGFVFVGASGFRVVNLGEASPDGINGFLNAKLIPTKKQDDREIPADRRFTANPRN